MSDKVNDTSGFTGDIDRMMDHIVPMQTDNGFSHIRRCYLSPSGPSCLFTAMRYGKQYILKGIKPDFMYTPVYRQVLVKEFEIGLQLDHPNICRTIGMETVDGPGEVIVMEYIDGETLQKMMDDHALDAATARKLTVQIADALDYLHSKQIVHRDLKPSNIMVTHNGHNAKLIDFSLSDSDAFAVMKEPAGTSGYIAPELMVNGEKADYRLDVYSFGMVVKDMAVATGDSQLARLAAACTRRNPATRPADKQQIVAILQTTRRRRLLLLLAAVIAALAALLLVFAAWQHHSRAAAGAAMDNTDAAGSENTVLDVSEWPQQEK